MNIKMKLYKGLHKLNTAQIIALGFAGVIFLGGILLWMPFCTAPGNHTSFSDAMFTATTCVCVTGLVTVVTAAHWTIAGKVIMLVLIQIGGIGLVALASIIFISMRKKISLRNRRIIQESYNLDSISGMARLVKKVVACVLAAELAGAVFYSIRFIPQFGLGRGLCQSVFTAVSAFCNAGVDLLGENSLADYVTDPVVNLTTMGLVILSGLGFTVWWDVWDKTKKVGHRSLKFRRAFKALRLHSKIVLTVTLILVLGGTFFILLFDWSNPDSLGALPAGKRFMAAAFQSVTVRTAGFFTIDQADFSNASAVLCMVLMLVGGSPMGTAGGIKTTTVVILLMSIRASLKGNTDVEIFHRKVRGSYVRSAVAVTGLGILTVLTGTILLCAAMPGEPVIDVLYETVSAAATVGLSRGLTSRLNTVGKWLIILTMYLGRIGPLTLGTAVTARAHKMQKNVHLAEEDIMIG